MIDREKEIDYLESQIPAVSGSALTIAYLQTLASGQSVLETDDGKIFEVFPDGSRKFVKEIAPRISMEKGKKVILG